MGTEANDLESFDKNYLILESNLLSDNLEYVRTTCIKGAEMAIDEVSIDSSTKLRRLRTDEMAQRLSTSLGLAYSSKEIEYGEVHSCSDLVFEKQIMVKKSFGTIAEIDNFQEAYREFSDKDVELAFLDVCSLVKAGRPRLASTIYECKQSLFNSGTIGYVDSLADSTPGVYWSLKDAEKDQLITVWGEASKAFSVRNFLKRSIRRFASSYTRTALEDRIIDLAIAGEALFLAGDDGNTEITWRLSHRAGAYIGETPTEKLRIFRNLKSFYALRSKVVHGVIELNDKTNQLKLAEYVALTNEISELIRKALLRAVSDSKNCNKHKTLVDDGTAYLY